MRHVLMRVLMRACKQVEYLITSKTPANLRAFIAHAIPEAVCPEERPADERAAPGTRLAQVGFGPAHDLVCWYIPGLSVDATSVFCVCFCAAAQELELHTRLGPAGSLSARPVPCPSPTPAL